MHVVRPTPEVEPAPERLSLEALYRQNARYVSTVALRLLGRDAEVDDVVQDVFLAAMSGLANLREPLAVRGWLATVTVRMATRRLRARRVWSFFGLDEIAHYEGLAQPGMTGEDRALLSHLYRALDELPVGDRVAWTLRHLEGEQLDEVARLCGCSLATAKRRIAAAQAALEKVVRDE